MISLFLPRLGTENGNTESVYINILLSSILFVMCITSLPAYFHSARSFCLIFRKGQPFYILLIFVLLTSFFNLFIAALDGVGFWTDISYCAMFGCLRTAILIVSSLLIAFVCTSRCIAVSSLDLYKKLNKTSVLTGVSGMLLLISILLPVLFLQLGHIKFKYLGPPSHVGCSPVLAEDSKHVFISFILFFLFVCDFILLVVYLVLYRRLHNPSLRPCMKKLKASARRVSLIITLTYLVLHLPIMVIYTIFTFNPTSVLSIPSAMGKLLLDFTLRFLSYLYSAILPAIIVKTGSMNEKTISAAKKSVMNQMITKNT